MNPSDRSDLKQKTQMFKAQESLEELRYSGKPFFWVDYERLKKLKKVAESQQDQATREKVKDALLEYKIYVDKYNSRVKGGGKQIHDIYTGEFQSPHHQEPLSIPKFYKNLSMDRQYKDAVVNISVQNESTGKGT